MRATREARRTGGCIGQGARSNAVKTAGRVKDPLLHPPADAFDISGTSVFSLHNFLAPTPDVTCRQALFILLRVRLPHAAYALISISGCIRFPQQRVGKANEDPESRCSQCKSLKKPGAFKTAKFSAHFANSAKLETHKNSK